MGKSGYNFGIVFRYQVLQHVQNSCVSFQHSMCDRIVLCTEALQQGA